MSCILHIETSTDICSVAVSNDSSCIWKEEDHSGPNHAVKLGVYVEEALSFANSHAIPVDAVAVSCGPGSYTGLRIGVSMAKGVCYGLGCKLISVPTLQLLCVPVLLNDKEPLPENALLCPMIDARRMEVYAAVYDRSLQIVREIHADVVDADTYRELLDKQPIYFFGNGSAKCRDRIIHPNAHFINDIEPLAINMQPLAEKRIANEQYEDVAYFEPFYLKEFIATKSKDPLASLAQKNSK
jgi:tRNA threonylcarbamoyladenosine biosynthesis protein TsaB